MSETIEKFKQRLMAAYGASLRTPGDDWLAVALEARKPDPTEGGPVPGCTCRANPPVRHAADCPARTIDATQGPESHFGDRPVPPDCNCHWCTQARYAGSLQGAMADQAMNIVPLWVTTVLERLERIEKQINEELSLRNMDFSEVEAIYREMLAAKKAREAELIRDAG